MNREVEALESDYTTYFDTIQGMDEKARYDAVCKRVLADKNILAWIMKSCLEEFRDCSISDIAEKYIEGVPEVAKVPVAPDETNASTHARIEGLSTEDTSVTEGTVTFDIRFRAVAPSDGKSIQLIVNIEAQNDFHPGYPLLKRAIYYCSRLISSQYKTVFDQARYGEIQKVYSVWVCMDPPIARENTIVRYRMIEETLVGEVCEPVEDYDLLSIVMICLGSPGKANYDGVLKLLGTLFSTNMDVLEKRGVLQNEFGIPMTQGLESEVLHMCNLSKGVEERGVAKGLAKGREEGRTEGRTFDLQNLMKHTGWSLEKAMIALGIPDAEREIYARLLKQL